VNAQLEKESSAKTRLITKISRDVAIDDVVEAAEHTISRTRYAAALAKQNRETEDMLLTEQLARDEAVRKTTRRISQE